MKKLSILVVLLTIHLRIIKSANTCSITTYNKTIYDISSQSRNRTDIMHMDELRNIGYGDENTDTFYVMIGNNTELFYYIMTGNQRLRRRHYHFVC